jgi:pyruvate carboxylase
VSAPFSRVLIANRGEIAIRIAQACDELGSETLAVYAEDDHASLHTRKADRAVALQGRGVAAYLDQAQLLAVARAEQCDAIHPGYGFLAENAAFAEQCEAAGIRFIGPGAEVLRQFGDKAAARALAERCEVPLVPGINRAIDLAEAEAFLNEHGALMLKALAGGGGRGMAPVGEEAQLADAFAHCQAQAQGAFGCGELYVEKLVQRARHIEVQVLGDGTGAVSHLWERDCSLQRQQQKLVEIAPSPDLDAATRERMIDCALRLAAEVRYRGIGTFEFLLDLDAPGRFYFMEANPRVQVEHTVTEQITGVDLLHAQLQLAAGRSLADLGLLAAPAPKGFAVQVRINAETQQEDGSTRPAAGTLSAYQPPSGPGLRIDGYGYAGYPVSPAYDSLLAKLIASASDYPAALRRAYRGLSEFAVEGVASNKALLQNLLRRDEVLTNDVDTRFVERHLGALLHAGEHPSRMAPHAATGSAQAVATPEGCEALTAHSAGVLVSLLVAEGDAVAAGQTLAVLEAMKMEFELRAPCSGVIHSIVLGEGATLAEGQTLLFVSPGEGTGEHQVSEEQIDLEHIRADLADVIERHDRLTDNRRPEAVAKRRKTGQRTARENLADLLDDGSFIEYGAMALAAQLRQLAPRSSASRPRAAWH